MDAEDNQSTTRPHKMAMRMPSSDGVAVGVRQAVDESGQPQAAEVVGHLAGAVVAAEQPGDQDTEVLVGEEGCGEQRLAECAGPGVSSAWKAHPTRST
jgi:hypothetical protein